MDLNKELKGEKSVEVVLLSRNSADTGLRIFNSIEHHNLDIKRAAFCGGSSPHTYAKSFGAHLFLSTEFSDCKLALKSGVAAARIIPTGVAKTRDSQLKVAFDGDAVIFSEESQEIYDSQGLDAFDKNEKNRANLTQEFRLALAHLIMGIYYKHLKEKDEAIGYLFGGAATNAWSHFDFQAKAGYIQYGFDFSPTLKANANIRYEQNEYDYLGSSQGLNANWEKEYLPPVEFKTENTMLGYRLSIQYLLDELEVRSASLQSPWGAMDLDRIGIFGHSYGCLLYTSPSPRDRG